MLKHKIHYGWGICGACVLLLICTVGVTTNSFPVFLPYLIEYGSLTKTQGAALSSIRCVFSFLSVLAFERYYGVTGMRVGMTLLALNVAVSCVLFSTAHGFAVFCIASAISGISHGLGGLVATSVLVNRWFKDRIGLALGTCASGAGIGVVFISPAATYLVEKYSLPVAYIVSACFAVLCAAIVYVLIRNSPQDVGLEMYVQDKRDVRKREKAECTVHYKKSSKVPAGVLASAFLIGATAFGVIPHIAVLLREHGYNSATASLAMSVYGITITSGKFIYGAVTDKIGTYRTGYIFSGFYIVSIMLFCVCKGNAAAAVLVTALYGLGSAQTSVALSLWAKDLTLPEDYPHMAKIIQAGYIAGGALCGTIPGIVADAVGSYIPAFFLMGVLAILALLFVQISYCRARI